MFGGVDHEGGILAETVVCLGSKLVASLGSCKLPREA